MKSVKLGKLVDTLDKWLEVDRFASDSALNGLQVEGGARVERVTLAVDACDSSIRAAARRRSDLLIVHHGLFWGGMTPVTGIMAKRLGLLLNNGISLYAAHLPLDCHPEIGNNAVLADRLGLEQREGFGEYHGCIIGIRGRLSSPVSAGGFASKVRRVTGEKVKSFRSGRDRIRTVGIVSGGGASMVREAAEAGCDAMLTGETSHSAFHVAGEYGINLFCAGHYATETFGVKALGKRIEEEFGIRTGFVDIPTGL